MVICILGWKHVVCDLSLLNIFYYAEKNEIQIRSHIPWKREKWWRPWHLIFILCTNACACMCVQAPVCLYMCVHASTCEHTRTQVFQGLRVHACMCVHMHACPRVHVSVSMYMRVCMCVLRVGGCLSMHVNVHIESRGQPPVSLVSSHACFSHRVSHWPKTQPGLCSLLLPSTETASLHQEIPRTIPIPWGRVASRVKLRSSCWEAWQALKWLSHFPSTWYSPLMVTVSLVVK